MKLLFNFQTTDDLGDKQAQVSRLMREYFVAKKDFSVEFKEEKNHKSQKSLNGYWRICTLLVPHVRKSYGEMFDKDLVSDLAKISAGYCVKTKTGNLPKSLKTISQEDMNILIEKLYFMCEFYGLKDYELVPYELQEINNYFKE
jgi:hypothetical protein